MTDDLSIHITVWNEFRVEMAKPLAAKHYPNGIHQAIARPLREQTDLSVRVATLDDPDQGLSDAALKWTDVLILWAHWAHNEVDEATVDRVQRNVLEGMGMIILHSGHYSKFFKRLMGTTCSLSWRQATDRERLWNLDPGHPILDGIGRYIELPVEEMYGEPFHIPAPDETLMISWFTGGEVFRSACTWRRGHGKLFYFRPGHEEFPTYHNAEIQRVIRNAVRWARPRVRLPDESPRVSPLEPLTEATEPGSCRPQ